MPHFIALGPQIFFVMLVGNKDVILEFKNIMDEDIFSTIGIDKVEFNIFTNDIS